MKKNKYKNSTVAIAALMGMTTAINPAFPTVHAQSMNDQNPTENQEISQIPEAESSQPQENTYSKDAQPIEEETKEQSVANTLEAPAPTNVQNTTNGVTIDETNFPDPVFRQWVKDNVMGAEDDILTPEEIASVKSIIIDAEHTEALSFLEKLDGVENFTNLKKLTVKYTKVTSLNLAKNIALDAITCTHNEIEDISLPSSNLLLEIDFSHNKIQFINLTKNPELTYINIDYNDLKDTLDVSKNTKLEKLYCSGCSLEALDLSQNEKLGVLGISSNRKLTSIDLSKNKMLTTILANYTGITSLNLTSNINLLGVEIQKGQLSSILLPDSTSLTRLTLNGNYLQSLNTSKLPNLSFLDCSENKELSTLILNPKSDTELQYLTAHNTKLNNIDLHSLSSLIELDLSGVNLSSLDTSKNINLTKLKCERNAQLRKLILPENSKITDLDISNSSISEFDGSKTPNLKYLYVNDNTSLKELNVDKNDELRWLNANNCSLSTINVTNNKKLTILYLRHNNLTTLDITNNKDLQKLNVTENSLTFLDTSKNTALTTLHCGGNQFLTLDVPDNTEVNDSSKAMITSISDLKLSTDKSFDLAKLDPTITEKKLDGIKNTIKNGRIEGTTLFVDNPKDAVTYEYYCGGKNKIILKVYLYTNGMYWTSDLKIENWIYGQAAKKPTITSNTGTITYSYSEDGVNFTTPDKVLTHAGTYYVKAEATDPTYGTISTTKEFQILKAPISENEISTFPSNLTSVSGNTLSSISLLNGWNWKEPSTKVSANNSGYVAYLTVDDTNYDYSSIEGYNETEHRIYRTLTVQVSKITNSWTTPLTVQDWVENESPVYPTAQAKYGTVSFLYSNSKDGTFTDTLPTTVGTWYVKAVVAGTADYEGLESDVASFAIKEAPKKAVNSWVTPLAVQGWIVTEEPILPTAKAKYGTVSFLYSDSKTGTFTDTLPTTAGTWYVKAVVASTADYEGLESDVATFTIKEAPKEETKETKPEVKKEASPIVETSATVHTNPAKLLLVFLGACLAFFKKKTQQE